MNAWLGSAAPSEDLRERAVEVFDERIGSAPAVHGGHGDGKEADHVGSDDAQRDDDQGREQDS